MAKNSLLFLSLAMIMAACATKEEGKEENFGDRLYADIVNLSDTYADSLSNASDSTAKERLFKAYNRKLDSINMVYPPETDLQMSHEQNEVLYRKIMKVREEWLAELPDSLPKDTIIED